MVSDNSARGKLMDPEKIAQLSVNYGLGIVLAVGMACFQGWLLKYVLAQNEKREQRLSDLIQKDLMNQTKAINDHDARSVSAISSMEEAHRRQREEHEQQRKAYERMEEENDRRREAQEKIIMALNALTASVSDLNKKEIYFQKKRTI